MNFSSKYEPANITLSAYDYEKWFKEESDNSIVKDDK